MVPSRVLAHRCHHCHRRSGLELVDHPAGPVLRCPCCAGVRVLDSSSNLSAAAR